MEKSPEFVSVTFTKLQYEILRDLLRDFLKASDGGELLAILARLPLGPRMSSSSSTWAENRKFTKLSSLKRDLEQNYYQPLPPHLKELNAEITAIYYSMTDSDPWWEAPLPFITRPNYMKTVDKPGKEPYPTVTPVHN